MTPVGEPELCLPRDRAGRFSTDLFERCRRSERASVAALTGTHVRSVSTRKVKAITEELYGHGLSAAAIRPINKRLDAELARFAGHHLDNPCLYPIPDARPEKLREDGGVARVRRRGTAPEQPVGRWIDCGAERGVAA